MGEPDKALLAGLDLARAEEWLPERTTDLSPAVIAFAQRSIAAEERKRERELRQERELAEALAKVRERELVQERELAEAQVRERERELKQASTLAAGRGKTILASLLGLTTAIVLSVFAFWQMRS